MLDVPHDQESFQPRVSNYGLYDTFYVMSSCPTLVDRVNLAEGDTVPVESGARIPWNGGGGEALTISDAVLRVSFVGPSQVLLLRNGQPESSLQEDNIVVGFDPSVYGAELLEYGSRLELKWGDALIVKGVRSEFTHVSAADPGPQPLRPIQPGWTVFVCVPEYCGGGPAAFDALHRPGVCRQIRERVEAFVAVWDASWDPSGGGRVVLSRNESRQAEYCAAATAFPLLLWGVRQEEVGGDDDAMEEGEDSAPGKRALDDDDDGDSCAAKRGRHQ